MWLTSAKSGRISTPSIMGPSGRCPTTPVPIPIELLSFRPCSTTAQPGPSCVSVACRIRILRQTASHEIITRSRHRYQTQNIAQVGPRLANIHRVWQQLADFGKLWSTPVHPGPDRAMLCPHRHHFCSGSGSSWPHSGRLWPQLPPLSLSHDAYGPTKLATAMSNNGGRPTQRAQARGV